MQCRQRGQYAPQCNSSQGWKCTVYILYMHTWLCAPNQIPKPERHGGRAGLQVPSAAIFHVDIGQGSQPTHWPSHKVKPPAGQKKQMEPHRFGFPECCLQKRQAWVFTRTELKALESSVGEMQCQRSQSTSSSSAMPLHLPPTCDPRASCAQTEGKRWVPDGASNLAG